jgi:hypothetical protein
MKMWLILGVLVAGIFQSIPKQTDKPQPNQNDSKHLAEQPPKPAPAGTENAPTAVPCPTKQEDGADSQSKQPGWCERLVAPVVSNWPLIAVAIWGILVARSTLHAIRWQAEETAKATQAMRDSIPLQTKAAEAASLNAQAVINAERAWVDADMFKAGVGFKYVVRVTNHGKSLARVVGFTLSYASYAAEVTELPASALRSLVEARMPGQILAAGTVNAPIFEFDISQYMSDDDRVGNTTAVFQARIEYQDIFDDKIGHTTEVVYSYKRSDSALAYLANYTKYT